MTAWDHWAEVHPLCPPLGDLLRKRMPQLWLRIHNLPEKRYPETEREIAIALHRNNTVATALLGIGASCVAILTEWERAQDFASWPIADGAPEWLIDEATRESLSGATFRWRALRWRPGIFDQEIQSVACDEVGGLAVFSPATGAVFCPYDGGADLFAPDAADAEVLRVMFKKWSSKLPSGL